MSVHHRSRQVIHNITPAHFTCIVDGGDRIRQRKTNYRGKRQFVLVADPSLWQTQTCYEDEGVLVDVGNKNRNAGVSSNGGNFHDTVGKDLRRVTRLPDIK
jgi:hypothetical protein